jgi:hypothetical protein
MVPPRTERKWEGAGTHQHHLGRASELKVPPSLSFLISLRTRGTRSSNPFPVYKGTWNGVGTTADNAISVRRIDKALPDFRVSSSGFLSVNAGLYGSAQVRLGSGTRSSNPASSGEESGANSIPGIRLAPTR